MESILQKKEYLRYFGFRDDPFQMQTPPLYFPKGWQTCLSQSVYFISYTNQLTILQGDAGAGKTSLLHFLKKELDDTIEYTAITACKEHTPLDLLNAISSAFELPPPPASDTIEPCLDALYHGFEASHFPGKITALLIDQVEALSDEAFKTLLLFSAKMRNAEGLLVHLFLVSDLSIAPQVKQWLGKALSESHLHVETLPPLTANEMIELLDTLWQAAGSTQSLPFSVQDIQHLHDKTKGNPKKIKALIRTKLIQRLPKKKKHPLHFIKKRSKKWLLVLMLMAAGIGLYNVVSTPVQLPKNTDTEHTVPFHDAR